MNNPQNNAGNQDYLDKAVDKAEQMIGKKTGHHVRPGQYSAQNEKFTDKLRGYLEKVTGKKAPAKFSN
nr:hypothetical protein B0A51_16485 [Rachicladosporium sp. CCFEE 5018]